MRKILKIIYYKWLHRQSTVRWKGKFLTWPQLSESYADEQIIRKVTWAAQQVFAGEAAFERDGVAFKNPVYNQPLLTAFLYFLSVIKKNYELVVLDFGGSLASNYFQHKPFFSAYIRKWIVAEQPVFIEAGRNIVKDPVVTFVDSVDQITDKIDIVLFSSVLQYIDNYSEILDNVLAHKPTAVIVDMTSVIEGETFISVQRVSAEIVASSYPMRLFNRSELINNFIKAGYRMMYEWDGYCAPKNFVVENEFVNWKGFLFVRDN